MALDLSKLSTTPASNDQASGFQTGMRPSAVKTAGWNTQSIIAQLFNALPAGAGTANAQTLANPVAFTTLTTGLVVYFLPGVANTGATTFAPDGLAAKNIFYNGAALVGGELSTTVPAVLKYDGTQWNLLVSAASAAFSQSLPTGAGTANAQTVTNSAGFKWTALITGGRVTFLPGVANTGACTLAVDGLTAKNIFYNGAALVGGELQTTIPAQCIYDGTQFNLIDSVESSVIKSMPTGAGTANAQTVANGIGFKWLTLVNGAEQTYIPNAANTGAVTLAIDGLTAKNIFVNGAACTGGELKAGYPALLKYDGTQFNLLNPYISGPTNYWADTGSVNALAIAAPIGAYANGQSFLVKVANTTTNSTPTINVNSLGAKNLYYPDGTTQILAGALILNTTYRVTYNSSLNAAAGGFEVESPSSITGSFTVTQTGYAANPTGTFNYRILPDGNTVYWWLSTTITGTSNATTMTWTGIPTLIQTTANVKNTPIWVENSGSWLIGTLNAVNSSTWILSAGIGGTAWANTGVKAVAGGGYQYNYTLNT